VRRLFAGVADQHFAPTQVNGYLNTALDDCGMLLCQLSGTFKVLASVIVVTRYDIVDLLGGPPSIEIWAKFGLVLQPKLPIFAKSYCFLCVGVSPVRGCVAIKVRCVAMCRHIFLPLRV
jgi:hypothetical protein